MRAVNADDLIHELDKDGIMEHGYVSVFGIPIIEDCVPVVRCKDCKWWYKVDNIDGVNYGTCERKCTAIRKDAFLNENWFCSDGEKVTE